MHQQFLLLIWTCKLVKNVENKNVQSYSFVFYKNNLNGFRNYQSLTLLLIIILFV